MDKWQFTFSIHIHHVIIGLSIGDLMIGWPKISHTGLVGNNVLTVSSYWKELHKERSSVKYCILTCSFKANMDSFQIIRCLLFLLVASQSYAISKEPLPPRPFEERLLEKMIEIDLKVQKALERLDTADNGNERRKSAISG